LIIDKKSENHNFLDSFQKWAYFRYLDVKKFIFIFVAPEWTFWGIVKFLELMTCGFRLVNCLLVLKIEFAFVLYILVDDIFIPLDFGDTLDLCLSGRLVDLFYLFLDNRYFLGFFSWREFFFGIVVAMKKKVIAEWHHAKIF